MSKRNGDPFIQCFLSPIFLSLLLWRVSFTLGCVWLVAHYLAHLSWSAWAEVLGACKLIKCVNMSQKKGWTLMMVLISVHAPKKKNSIDERRVALIFELRTFPTNWLTSWVRKEVKVLEGCMATICMPFFLRMGFDGWVRPSFKISHFKFALVILWHTFLGVVELKNFFIAHSQHFATFCWPVWLTLYLLEGGRGNEGGNGGHVLSSRDSRICLYSQILNLRFFPAICSLCSVQIFQFLFVCLSLSVLYAT